MDMREAHDQLAAANCDHCGQFAGVYQDHNILLVKVYSPTQGEFKHIVCGPCSLELAEFLSPGLLKDAEYIHAKDQCLATYREQGRL